MSAFFSSFLAATQTPNQYLKHRIETTSPYSIAEFVTPDNDIQLQKRQKISDQNTYVCPQDITDKELEDLGKKRPNIRKLILSKCRRVTNFEPLKLFDCLEELDLSYCSRIKFKQFDHLKDLRHLKTLNLIWCSQLRDLNFLKESKNLEVLFLVRCINITNLEPLYNKTFLRHVDVSSCCKLKRPAILAFHIELDKLSVRPSVLNCRDTEQGYRHVRVLPRDVRGISFASESIGVYPLNFDFENESGAAI